MSRIETCTLCGAVRTIAAPTPLPDLTEEARRLLAIDLSGAPVGCYQFFSCLFDPITPARAKLYAHELGLHPSTLISRFFRAGLPSPKAYLLHAQLVRAVWLRELNPRRSLAWLAMELDYSSPQSFHRTVKMVSGRTAAQYFDGRTAAAALEEFRELLILPHRAVLLNFDPMTEPAVRRARRVA